MKLLLVGLIADPNSKKKGEVLEIKVQLKTSKLYQTEIILNRCVFLKSDLYKIYPLKEDEGTYGYNYINYKTKYKALIIIEDKGNNKEKAINKLKQWQETQHKTQENERKESEKD